MFYSIVPQWLCRLNRRQYLTRLTHGPVAVAYIRLYCDYRGTHNHATTQNATAGRGPIVVLGPTC